MTADPANEPAEAAATDTPREDSSQGEASASAISPSEAGLPDQAHRKRRRRRRRRSGTASAGDAASPSGEPDSAAPPIDGEAAGNRAADETAAGDADADDAGTPGSNTLRLRTRPPRRRRRRPLIAGAPAAASSDSAAAVPGAEGAGEAAAPAVPASGPRLGPDGQPLRRRRRRRRPPQLGSAGETGAAPSAEAAAATPRAPGDRPPRRNNRNRRGPRLTEAGTSQEGRSEREHGARQARGDGPRGDRERGPRRDGRRDDRRGSRGDRRDAPKKIERKLYSMDAIVDRGFEDVEEEGAEPRRVHWTIVKRTVADQVTRKAMSQNYVLQRDGVDSEFPTLGAARDAVNKKIVHPEKLTLSKADHAAQKGNSR